MRNKIPKHWQVKKLGEICEINPKTEISEISDMDNVSFIPMSCVEAEKNKFTTIDSQYKVVKKGYTKFKDNDVLFAKITPCMENGKICIVNDLKFGFGFGSTEFHVLRPNIYTLSKYTYFFVSQACFRKRAEKFMTGAVGQRRVPAKYLVDLEIPLPSLDEQNLIVKKIERCFEKIDFAISNFKKSKELIEIYKQSVLSHAFNGKLTNSNLNSWQVKKLCDTSDIITGSTPPKNEPKFYGNEYPFFKPTDLNDGYLVKFARDNLSEAGKQISRQLPPKSVLVTCIGATIGKTGLIRVEGSCNQQINAIVPKENLLPEYVYFYVISAQFQNLILENASSTTLPILNKSKFEALPILLPPLSEQNLIVVQIEKRFKAADNALNLIEQNLKKAEILKQSILSKAFNGELVKDKK